MHVGIGIVTDMQRQTSYIYIYIFLPSRTILETNVFKIRNENKTESEIKMHKILIYIVRNIEI